METTADQLISSVFASAVKISLNEQKKKGSSHNKTSGKAIVKKTPITSHGATATHDIPSPTEDVSR